VAGDERQFRIAEQAADGLYVVDHDGLFAYVNPAAVALFGYDDERELLGRNSHATTHHRRLDGSPFPAEECPLLRPRTTGESVHVDDDWFVRKDGSLIPVAYSSAPYPMASGTGAVVAIRDMTELRRAEDELRVLQAVTLVIGSAEDYEGAVASVIETVCREAGWVAGEMWVPDADGARLELAPGWWVSRPDQEPFFLEASAPQTMARGEGLPGMVWEQRRPVWIDVLTTWRRGPRIEMARRCGFAAGVGVPVLADGEVVAVLGLFADHRRTEDARWTNVLTSIAAQLGPVLSRKRAEDELARQAVELARSNAELSLYAEMTAHELQQPLHAVARLLDLALADEAEAERLGLLETALTTARHLQDSVDALLRYASVGRPETHLVSVDAVVEQALADLALELEAAGAEVVRAPLPDAHADAAQLGSVFRNLLSNALRYRGEAPLRLEIGAGDGVYSVRDNGRGIDPADQRRVLDLFGRGAAAGDVDGVGIGLALARRIAQAHGGELWLESEPGRGTTVFFRLAPPR